MQRKFIISYLCIFFTILGLMSLSRPISEKFRGTTIALFAPLWEFLIDFKRSLTQPKSSEPALAHSSGMILTPQEEIKRLELENQLLINQLVFVKELLWDKQSLDRQRQSAAISDPVQNEESYRKYIQRLTQTFQFKLKALPARVIFRSLDAWNNALWINVGEEDNLKYPTPIVAKYSPVLAGNSIIGVIDYVGKKQARVRLITDPALTPSVRAVRGGEQDDFMLDQINFLLHLLEQKKVGTLSPTDQDALIKLLATLKSTLQPFKKSWYLAKGELQGSLTSFHTLRGTGFNYDFGDEEGEARDLRTGKVVQDATSTPIPIIKANDILVTTGMDGIFPAGLKVALVTKIDLLKEGDYYYELEAKPTAGNLNELSLVFVIPPLGYTQDNP